MFISSIKGLNTQTSNITVGPDALRDCRNVVFTKTNFVESRHGHQFSPFKNPGTSIPGTNTFSGSNQVVSFFYDDIAAQFYYTARYADQPDASLTRANYKPTLFKWKNSIYQQTNTGIALNTAGSFGSVDFGQLEIYKVAALSYKAVANDQTHPPILLPQFKCGVAATIVQIVDDIEIESSPVFGEVENLKTEAFSIIAGIFIKGTNNTAITGKNLFVRLYRTKQVPIRITNSSDAQENFKSNPLPTEYYQTSPDALLSTQFKSQNFTITAGSGGVDNVNRSFFAPAIPGTTSGARVVKVLKGEDTPTLTDSLILAKSDFDTNARNPLLINVDGSYVIIEPDSGNQRILGEYRIPMSGITDGASHSIDVLVGQSISVTTNDDALQSSLYTNPNTDGLVGANIAIPGSRGITEYKSNYLSYSLNAIDPATYTILGQAGSSQNRMELVANSIPVGQAWYVDTLAYLNTSLNRVNVNATWPEIHTYRDDTFTGPVVAALQNQTIHALGDGAGGSLAINNTNNSIVVTLLPSTSNNLAKFVSPGIVAISQTDGTVPGQVKAVVQYKSVTVSGLTMTFNDIAIAGNNAATPATSIQLGGSYGLTYIPGETYNNLAIYLQWVPLQRLFMYSLTIEDSFDKIPYGLVSSYNVVISSNQYTATRANALLLGVDALSPSSILDEQTTKLIDDLNHSDHFRSFSTRQWSFMAKRTINTGEFYIRPANHTVSFSLTSSTPSSIANSGVVFNRIIRKNQFYVSRQNNPFVTTERQYFTPFKVGEENEEIQRIITNVDSIYILKDKTTWRTSIPYNTASGLPVIDDIILFDPTTGCVEGRSAQEIDQEIIWLDYSGFVSIRGQQVNNIGLEIENEVKDAFNVCKSQGFTREISSFGNAVKHLYGCFIPTARTGVYPDFVYTGTTYVFDTLIRQWSKWDMPFVDANVDSEGRLSTLRTSNDGVYTIHSRDTYTSGNPYNPLDQYDARFDVSQNPTTYVINDPNPLLNGLATWTIPMGSGLASSSYFGREFAGKRAYLRLTNPALPALPEFIEVVVNFSTNFTVQVVNPTDYTKVDSLTFAGKSLFIPVDSMVEFQPYTGQNPSTLKQFPEWHVHTENAVHGPRMRFKTDSRATYTSWRNFSTFAANRTVYRTFISTEACRGRWLIRSVDHAYPFEYFRMTGQEIVARETGSLTSQKGGR